MTADTQKAVIAADRAHAPGYVLWVLADPNATLPILAARLHGTLGREQEMESLLPVTGQRVGQLIQEVVARFEHNEGLCSEFLLVRSTRDELDRLAEAVKTRAGLALPNR